MDDLFFIGGTQEWADLFIALSFFGYGCGVMQREKVYGPGREKAASLPFEEKAKCIKSELSKKIKAAMGTSFNPSRFIPYIMMYEFEGLLFSDCVKFSKGINYPNLQPKFQMIRNQIQSPEEINDSSNTAPSKRIEKLFPGYQKPLNGTLAILEIGLETIRKECTNFDLWIKALEETK